MRRRVWSGPCSFASATAARSNALHSRERSRPLGMSIRLDVRGLDDRPPFLNVRHQQCTERFWCLLLAWWNLLPEIDEQLSHRRIGQGNHPGSVKLRDDALWCSLG